jgi:hypothetical protein
MTKIVITRKQFEQLKEIFDEYDVDRVLWKEESISGIGPTITVEFDSTTLSKRDLTDVESW